MSIDTCFKNHGDRIIYENGGQCFEGNLAYRAVLRALELTADLDFYSKKDEPCYPYIVSVTTQRSKLERFAEKAKELFMISAPDRVKVDISKVFDVSDKQDKKGARVLNIYAGTTDWSFYDKVADSLRPKNKRSDKDHIDHERQFIISHNLENKEIFRYEYRIKKNQKN